MNINISCHVIALLSPVGVAEVPTLAAADNATALMGLAENGGAETQLRMELSPAFCSGTEMGLRLKKWVDDLAIFLGEGFLRDFVGRFRKWIWHDLSIPKLGFDRQVLKPTKSGEE